MKLSGAMRESENGEAVAPERLLKLYMLLENEAAAGVVS